MQVVQLAARHNEKLRYQDVAARYNTQSFPAFLELFKWATSYLRDPQDYALLCEHPGLHLAAENCVYAEITLSVGVMLLRKQNVEANFAAITDAMDRYAKPSGLRVRWIFDAVRQFGPEKAMEVALLAAQMKSAGVVAFGLGGDEESLPASDFRKVFNYAAAEGLHRVTHAGEMGGPQNIRDAIEILGAERIGHGSAAIHDESLMALLIERQIPLEICPTSNLRTGALAKLLARNVSADARATQPLWGRSFSSDLHRGGKTGALAPEGQTSRNDSAASETSREAAGALGGRSFSSDIHPPETSGASAPEGPQLPRESISPNEPALPAAARLENHPLAQFVARGIPVTLASDDPAMFRTTLLAEYTLALAKMGLTLPQLISITEAAFRYAFLPAAEKNSLLDNFRSAASKLKPL